MTLFLDLFCLITYHIIYILLHESIIRKNFLIEDGICRTENNIFLCIAYKIITIILTFDEYH